MKHREESRKRAPKAVRAPVRGHAERTAILAEPKRGGHAFRKRRSVRER